MRVYVQSIYLVGGGLIVEANIPVQELEGQRGEGAYFLEDTVHVCWVHGKLDGTSNEHNGCTSSIIKRAYR